MNVLGAKERRALRPDAQAFDEIRITTTPRYKTSGMSGDEWRISATVQFFRKGRLVHEDGCRDVQTACGLLYSMHCHAQDDGKGYFASEDDFCDQEGCAEKATVKYALKKDFCREGHESDPHRFHTAQLIRQFCDRHKTRGDCGLEDADANYEVISGSREGTDWRGANISESSQVIVKVDSVDDIPLALSGVMKDLKK